jgi:hypothetical protein
MSEPELIRETLENVLRNYIESPSQRTQAVAECTKALCPPKQHKYGATVMTPEASKAGDDERQHGADPNRS